MSEGRPVVIVADDDVTLRRTTAELLEDAGYETREAANGLEVLALCEKARPDLIALDIMMPKMDGFETLAHLRETDRVTPVLFLSARGDIVDKRTGFRLGAATTTSLSPSWPRSCCCAWRPCFGASMRWERRWRPRHRLR